MAKRNFFNTKSHIESEKKRSRLRGLKRKRERYVAAYKVYEQQKIAERVSTEYSIKSMK